MITKYRPPFIIDSSSTGGVSREGVFHKCSNIYTPHPKTAPDQRMLNRYFPSQETPQRFGTHMIYYVWLCSCHPCNLTIIFFFFITNNPIRKKTFVKWSIITLSRISKVNQHLASHKFLTHQVYQIRSFFLTRYQL